MSGNDFFTFYEKNRSMTQSECQKCSACKFPDYRMKKIVWIPPPKKGDLKGVIISRDPTTGFIELYNEASKKSDEECRKDLMGDKGVPINTINGRIEKLYPGEGTRKNLSNFLLNNCYWTHLLKCCTYSSRKNDLGSIPFHEACQTGYVECCSKQWLIRELNLICEQPHIEVIILLGADVTKTVYRLLSINNQEKWHKSERYRGCSLIPLPHPSRANGASWASPNSTILENIEKINELCGTSG